MGTNSGPGARSVRWGANGIAASASRRRAGGDQRNKRRPWLLDAWQALSSMSGQAPVPRPGTGALGLAPFDRLSLFSTHLCETNMITSLRSTQNAPSLTGLAPPEVGLAPPEVGLAPPEVGLDNYVETGYKYAIAKRAASKAGRKMPTNSFMVQLARAPCVRSYPAIRNRRLFRPSAGSRMAILELFHGSFDNPWRGALWSEMKIPIKG